MLRAEGISGEHLDEQTEVRFAPVLAGERLGLLAKPVAVCRFFPASPEIGVPFTGGRDISDGFRQQACQVLSPV